MRVPRRTIAITVLLAACQPGGELAVSVTGPSAITFSFEGDSDEACIENLRINPNGTTADTPAIWEIEQIYVAPSDPGTAGVLMTSPDPECIKEVYFPKVPKGFELVSSNPITSLPPGEYWVTGHAFQYWLSGDFSVNEH